MNLCLTTEILEGKNATTIVVSGYNKKQVSGYNSNSVSGYNI
jgi:hypothetical protein